MTGYVSIFDIVHQMWHLTAVKGFTAGLIGFVCLFGINFSIYILKYHRDDDPILQTWVLLAFYSLGALHSDWILASITGNWAGAPDGNNAVLYWGYFVAKILSFFFLLDTGALHILVFA